MDTKRLSDTGSEPISLYKQRDQISRLFQISPMRKFLSASCRDTPVRNSMANRFNSSLNVWMGPFDLFPHTSDRLIQAKTCLDTDHHQIQGIRNRPLQRILPIVQSPFSTRALGA